MTELVATEQSRRACSNPYVEFARTYRISSRFQTKDQDREPEALLDFLQRESASQDKYLDMARQH